MNKRFQVFLSSTYADLKEERQKVIQALMDMDCIPAGMEMFPAADEEQWEFIKKVIDDCDYYLLIIGGRYGSTTTEGISYTEKEYDYAIAKNIKVIALLHEAPDEIIVSKTDKDAALGERLNAFRAKVQTNRLVKYWKTANELPGLVALSLSKTIKAYPAIGWVRATEMASAKLLEEVNKLTKENAELRDKVQLYENSRIDGIEDLAGSDELITMHGTAFENGSIKAWQLAISWNDLFGLIAPELMEFRVNSYVEGQLLTFLLARARIPSSLIKTLNRFDFDTVRFQFQAYGWIDVQNLKTSDGGSALFWRLSSKGMLVMIQVRAIRTNKVRTADTA